MWVHIMVQVGVTVTVEVLVGCDDGLVGRSKAHAERRGA